MEQQEFVYRLWSNRSASFVGQAYHTEQGAKDEADSIQKMYYHALHTVEIERFPRISTQLHGDVIYETKVL